MPLLPFCLPIPPAAGRGETSCRFQTLVRYPGKLREVPEQGAQGGAGCHGVTQGVFCSVDPVNFVRFRPGVCSGLLTRRHEDGGEGGFAALSFRTVRQAGGRMIAGPAAGRGIFVSSCETDIPTCSTHPHRRGTVSRKPQQERQ